MNSELAAMRPQYAISVASTKITAKWLMRHPNDVFSFIIQIKTELYQVSDCAEEPVASWRL